MRRILTLLTLFVTGAGLAGAQTLQAASFLQAGPTATFLADDRLDPGLSLGWETAWTGLINADFGLTGGLGLVQTVNGTAYTSGPFTYRSFTSFGGGVRLGWTFGSHWQILGLFDISYNQYVTEALPYLSTSGGLETRWFWTLPSRLGVLSLAFPLRILPDPDLSLAVQTSVLLGWRL